MKHSLKLLYRLWPRSAVPGEATEPIVDLVNRGVSVAEIAREWLTAKRSRQEMAPQQLEKIESGPGNGMGSEASNPQDVVDGRAADRSRLRLTSRENDKRAPLRNSLAGSGGGGRGVGGPRQRPVACRWGAARLAAARLQRFEVFGVGVRCRSVSSRRHAVSGSVPKARRRPFRCDRVP